MHALIMCGGKGERIKDFCSDKTMLEFKDKPLIEHIILALKKSEQFNKIFAVHVNVFWQQPARELSVIKKLLRPSGAVYLFYQPLEPGKTQELVDKLTKNLQNNGFSIAQVLYKDLESGPAVCVRFVDSR